MEGEDDVHLYWVGRLQGGVEAKEVKVLGA